MLCSRIWFNFFCCQGNANECLAKSIWMQQNCDVNVMQLQWECNENSIAMWCKLNLNQMQNDMNAMQMQCECNANATHCVSYANGWTIK